MSILLDHYNLLMACKQMGLNMQSVVGEIIKRGQANGILMEVRSFIPNFFDSSSAWSLINELQLNFGVKVESCPVLITGDNRKDMVDLYFLDYVSNHVHQDIGPQSIV